MKKVTIAWQDVNLAPDCMGEERRRSILLACQKLVDGTIPNDGGELYRVANSWVERDGVTIVVHAGAVKYVCNVDDDKLYVQDGEQLRELGDADDDYMSTKAIEGLVLRAVLSRKYPRPV